MANQAPSVVPQVAGLAMNSSTSSAAARLFFRRLLDSARLAYSQSRPWWELADRSAFSRPLSVAEATSRMRKNWAYFRINYLLTLVGVVAAFLFAHPLSLLTLCGLVGAWAFLYLFRTEPLVFKGRQYSEREVLTLMVVLSVVVIFLTNVGSLLMSAVVVGLGIVAAHGAFRVPDDLFLDEPEFSTGFLSFLPRPPVASQV